uniref:8.9 kDa family member n=1 Tax=Rhipicephalus zambeziensis TaxID=60191 RepID=A0A224Y1C9_9ACAR
MMMPSLFAVVLVFVGVYALDTTTPKPPGPGEGQPPFPGPVPIIEVKDVGVIGGKCSYGGLMLEPTTLNLMKEPCEAWTCDAENYTVTIQRCGDFQVPQHCELEAALEAFPSCCPILICGGI